jgi:hypothetical protein
VYSQCSIPTNHIGDDDGSQVLDRAVLVLAAELVHKKTLAATRVRLGHDLVDDMLDGDIRSASANEFMARARALRHDLREPYRAWPRLARDTTPRALGDVPGESAHPLRITVLVQENASSRVQPYFSKIITGLWTYTRSSPSWYRSAE